MDKNLHDQMPENVGETVAKGCLRLSASALSETINGKCFVGLYRPPFQYVMRFSTDGALWGRNNYGTEDIGRWSIDNDNASLSVTWDRGWDANTTSAYIDGQAIHLFDAETGVWRTTLLGEIQSSDLSSPDISSLIQDRNII